MFGNGRQIRFFWKNTPFIETYSKVVMIVPLSIQWFLEASSRPGAPVVSQTIIRLQRATEPVSPPPDTADKQGADEPTSESSPSLIPTKTHCRGLRGVVGVFFKLPIPVPA